MSTIISPKTPRLIIEELYEDKNFIGIIDYCTTQSALDDSNYLYYGARGSALYSLKEYDKAVLDITKAIELNPEYVAGLFNRSKCYFDLKKYDLVINDIEKAHSIDSDSSFFDLLGISYSLTDNHVKAIENYDFYLNTNKDSEVLIWKAESHIYLNQLKEAIRTYELILLLEFEDVKTLERIERINMIANEEVYWNIAVAAGNADILASIESAGFAPIRSGTISGIYILQFNNGEYYIGQTKKIQNRLKQHFNRFDDIKYIYFKPVSESLLLEEENRTISLFENKLLRIRNIKQINFKNIFNYSHQKQWILDFQYNYLSGTKFSNQIVREKYSARFQLLKTKPYFCKFVSFISLYIKNAIPNYIASEYNYWNITCFPKHLLKDNCISRININAVPVLSVWANIDSSLQAMFYVSKLPFVRYLQENSNFDSLFGNIPSLKFEIRNAFEIAEGDELGLVIEEEDLESALNNDVIRSAIRLFNLRMMNKVGKEQGYRRSISHCLDLSDLIIADNQQLFASAK